MFDIIRTSRLVACQGKDRFNNFGNIYANYWNSIPSLVFGTTEVRARTGSFATPWGAPSGKEFAPPDLIHINDHFNDICDQRALEIFRISKDENKKIALMWSGGIDSTTVLTSFLKNIQSNDLENITIFLSTASIIENPIFYQKFIAGKIKCESIYNLVVDDNFLNHYIIIHGDPGDCIFGPSVGVFENLLDDNRHRLPWKNNIPIIKQGLFSSVSVPVDSDYLTGFTNWYVDKISNNLIEVNPDGIESIADWWWWHYFNFKWEFSISRPFFNYQHSVIRKSLSIENIQSYAKNTFFNTTQFQLWSYSNLKTHIGNSKKDHKMAAKKYIFELDQNLEYFNNKIKVSSVPKKNITVTLGKQAEFYDQLWKPYIGNEAKETVKELLENYTG